MDDAHRPGRSVLCGRRENGKEQLGEIKVACGARVIQLSVFFFCSKPGSEQRGLRILVSAYLKHASRIGCRNLDS